MRARIIVTLKSGVLDPQGEAIKNSLNALGFENINSVRQGKLFEIDIDEDDREKSLKSVKDMCRKLLVNQVIEKYSIELDDASKN